MPRETRTIQVPLTMHLFSTAPHDIEGGCCLSCDAYLDFNQPDTGSPDRSSGCATRAGTGT